ncbi:MAG: glycosyltransferase family 39 protein, partial [Pirellulaceae bacterium]|nr:glycosyltransferase family 39 protein [Pirellulaceae bacterium]
MKSSQVLVVACLFVLTAAALAIRLPRLDQRPMHGDEANQAVKAGVLLEAGQYQYDPQEHHGPSLYWLTLPSLWLHGRETFAQTTETDYRIVPVVFGVGLIVLLWFLADGLGRGPAVLAGLFTAISPALVFYSRYYIQETLLVFFTLAALAAGWRYARNGTTIWAILCGAAVGMMHATKETWVLAGAAAGLGG